MSKTSVKPQNPHSYRPFLKTNLACSLAVGLISVFYPKRVSKNLDGCVFIYREVFDGREHEFIVASSS